jgi:hypothetical protein
MVGIASSLHGGVSDVPAHVFPALPFRPKSFFFYWSAGMEPIPALLNENNFGPLTEYLYLLHIYIRQRIENIFFNEYCC